MYFNMKFLQVFVIQKATDKIGLPSKTEVEETVPIIICSALTKILHFSGLWNSFFNANPVSRNTWQQNTHKCRIADEVFVQY